MNRRRFIKLILGLGAVGAGYGWYRPPNDPAPALLGQATFATTSATSPPTTPPQPLATPSSAVPTTRTTVSVIGKEGWGAAPIVGTFSEHVIERITVHHTASLLESNQDAPSHVRQHQAFHQQDRGWADLAYHFIVDRNGHVYEGRPVWAVGDTGTNYDPTGHFLVCLEGNFDSQQPTSEQLASVAGLVAWASAEYGVGLDTISGHRDVASTSCPGVSVYAQLGNIAAQAQLVLRDTDVDLVILDEIAGGGLVAEIEAGRA